MSIPKWLRALLFHRTELPCGCVVTDSGLPRFSDRVTEMEHERVEVERRPYTNATVTKYERSARLLCDQCGTKWTQRHGGHRKTDYDDENPDASVRLEVKHSPGPWGGSYIHEAVPVVEDDEA